MIFSQRMVDQVILMIILLLKSVITKYSADYIFYVYHPAEKGYIDFSDYKHHSNASISSMPITSFIWRRTDYNNHNIIQVASSNNDLVWDTSFVGTKLILHKYNGTAAQQFLVDMNIDGTHRIMSKGKCLTVDNKKKLQFKACKIAKNTQKFLIIKIATPPLNRAVEYKNSKNAHPNKRQFKYVKDHLSVNAQNLRSKHYINLDMFFNPIKRCELATIFDTSIEFNNEEGGTSFGDMDALGAIAGDDNKEVFLSKQNIF